MIIHKRIYGETECGEMVFEYTMINSLGMKVSVLNLGATISGIFVSNRNGTFENVVLALNDIHGYEKNQAYIGCVVGRYAGRIKDGILKIDDKTYSLDRNEGQNSLHGGFLGFNRVIWDVEEMITDESLQLRLTYLSKDGEGGYPGDLKVSVVYRLYEDNSLAIIYEALSDKKTAISFTNHSYFNLSCNAEQVTEHYLSINTPYVLELTEDMLAGEKILDLREYGLDGISNKISDYMITLERLSHFYGIDHSFVLNNSESYELNLAADYYDKSSGRGMLVYTDLPYINIYSGNFLNKDIVLKGGKAATQFGGICFETQEQPNGPHHMGLGYKFLEPNENYRRTTVIRFFVK